MSDVIVMRWRYHYGRSCWYWSRHVNIRVGGHTVYIIAVLSARAAAKTVMVGHARERDCERGQF